MKITEYPKVKEIDKSDVFIVDGEKGTRQIDVEDSIFSLNDVLFNYEMISHLNTFRGKNLGKVFTDEQKAHVTNKTFKDLYIGDYWVDSEGNEWTIADINYFSRIEAANYTPHLVIIPKDPLYEYPMFNEETSISSRLYLNTDMVKTGLNKALSLAQGIFGDSIWTLRKLYRGTNTESGANSFTNTERFDYAERNIDLMSINMLFGISSDVRNTASGRVTAYPKQFSIFRINPFFTQLSGGSFWLQDQGLLPQYYASYDGGIIQYVQGLTTPKLVRPYILVRG